MRVALKDSSQVFVSWLARTNDLCRSSVGKDMGIHGFHDDGPRTDHGMFSNVDAVNQNRPDADRGIDEQGLTTTPAITTVPSPRVASPAMDALG